MQDRRTAAIRRLKAKRNFRQHWATYAVVNGFLVVVWAMGGASYFWPAWSIAGWGIGLALHGWRIYGEQPITEAEIQREVDRGRFADPEDS